MVADDDPGTGRDHISIEIQVGNCKRGAGTKYAQRNKNQGLPPSPAVLYEAARGNAADDVWWGQLANHYRRHGVGLADDDEESTGSGYSE